jgi:YD repeat-containing protein
MRRGTTFIGLCLITIMSAGCVANRVHLEEGGVSGASTIIVASIGNDRHGLPILGAPLTERPSRQGEHFTIVRLAGDRPVSSCDIAVVGRHPDFHKPIQAIYEWTGKGFRLGLRITEIFMQGFQGGVSPGPEGGGAVLVIVFSPLVAGTAGGFAIGVADGIVKTAEELGKTLTKDERAITCTTYEYDSLDRLRAIRMYKPDRSRELVRTTFEYDGTSRVPIKTVVKSLVEGTEQEVR